MPGLETIVYEQITDVFEQTARIPNAFMGQVLIAGDGPPIEIDFIEETATAKLNVHYFQRP